MQAKETTKAMAAEKMIKISKATYERLKDYGKFRDTFDEVIARVLDENDKMREQLRPPMKRPENKPFKLKEVKLKDPDMHR